MMLSLLRNVPQVEERCRKGMTKDGLVGREQKRKTVGVVGTGAIGSRVAELCHLFGCEIAAYDLFPKKNAPEYLHYGTLEEVLSKSDIVTLHCPLTEDSRGAGVDVFEMEPPLPMDHPLLHSINTIVTPHIAFASDESMEIRAKIVFENIQKWMNKEQVNTIL